MISPFNDSYEVRLILSYIIYKQLALPHLSSSSQINILVITCYLSWPRYDQQKNPTRTNIRISRGMLAITPSITSRPQVPGQHIAYVFVLKALSLNQSVFYKVCLQNYRLIACCSSIYCIITKLE
jgi:hypothetical protein